MAFTKALYYPWIDIRDEGWLKTSMLYWESIQTIVPESIKKPYVNRTANAFHNEGLVKPLRVNPNMREIEELGDDVLDYLESPEGKKVLMLRETPNGFRIHREKLPMPIDEMMHYQKFPEQIRRTLSGNAYDFKKGEWLSVPAPFAGFYITLLATHLAESKGIELLTDNTLFNELAVEARLDGRIDSLLDDDMPSRWRYNRRHRRREPRTLNQGLLAKLIMERIEIDPETSVKKIIAFRKKHSDELGLFRTKIEELAKTISIDQPVDAIRQSLEDNYTNQVKPAINNLKSSLGGSGIKFGVNGFISLVGMAGGTAYLLQLLGVTDQMALLASAGAGAIVSIVASKVLYNIQKTEILTGNPFTYVFAVEKKFRKRKKKRRG